jgi:hypothetical protein
VQAFQTTSAITNGVGRDLSVQALYAGPYALLISNVQFGAGRAPYAPSGAAPKSSSFMTLWNTAVSWGLAQQGGFSSGRYNDGESQGDELMMGN